MIDAIVADPLGTTDLWAGDEIDEPWGFLATCHELSQAMSLMNPDGFVSHLPVPLDGSCNGLQHLSAMGLDPVGAQATNLAPGPRQDVYEEVATRVRALVADDAAAGIVEAIEWVGNITRKVVKRAVMTTPYGVTDRGIRTQLINDGHVPDGDQTRELADYLGDKLVVALGQTISKGKEIMSWLQSSAFALAEAGRPFDWTTPTGSRVRQAYRVVQKHQVQTLVGRVVLLEEIDGGALNARKQALGAAPNFVHSFDAAHLSMTVNACHQEGMRSFAVVHDSYASHAQNTTTLARVLREQFVSIYKDDWLHLTHAEMLAFAPGVGIAPPPSRGEFDITQVRDAEFFFA
jgi:DNA-directed RNA polymerase